MANIKISGLPTVTSLDTQSLVPAVKSGETSHITFENLMRNTALVEANSGGSDDTITITQGGQAKKIKVQTLLNLMIFAEVNGIDLGDFLVIATPEGSRRVSFANLMESVLSNTPNASTTVSGLVELATLAEAQAGSSDHVANTAILKQLLDLKANLDSPALTGNPTAPTQPAGSNDTRLATTAYVAAATPNASTTVSGLIKIANNSETAALSDSSRAVSPSGLGSLFTKSFSTNGYQKLPGGLIIQWGETQPLSSLSDTTVTLPISFSQAFFTVVISQSYVPDSAAIGYSSVVPHTLSSFIARTNHSGRRNKFIAIGC